MREETRCRHMGYSSRLTARVRLHASSHRQDSTYHGLCYTSRGSLDGTRIWMDRCEVTATRCTFPYTVYYEKHSTMQMTTTSGFQAPRKRKIQAFHHLLLQFHCLTEINLLMICRVKVKVNIFNLNLKTLTLVMLTKKRSNHTLQTNRDGKL